jgi:hypothetical protein
MGVKSAQKSHGGNCQMNAARKVSGGESFCCQRKKIWLVEMRPGIDQSPMRSAHL